jgi:penicillin-binding protein-related factor A (putative recombinase)
MVNTKIENKERGQKNFQKDDVLGRKGEDIFISLIKSLGFTNVDKNKSENKKELSKWDIEGFYGGRRWTFEIKTDARAADTGNLCIEHSRFNFSGIQEPSGVSVTTADFFVSIIPDLREVRIIYTSKLKEIIEEDKYKLRTVPMGDDLRTRGYLMKIKSYEKHYRAIHRI